MRAFWACVAALIGGLILPMEAMAQRRVLYFNPGGDDRVVRDLNTDTSVTTGISRTTFTTPTEAAWRAMTTADFATYNAIWIDGGNCGVSAPAPQEQVLRDTRLTWSAAIIMSLSCSTTMTELPVSRSFFKASMSRWLSR